MSPLDEEIVFLQQLCEQLDWDDPQMPRSRHELAQVFFERCQATSNALGDLSAAIEQETKALENAKSLGYLEQEDIAVSLTEMLFYRWEKSRASENLEAALMRGIQTMTFVSEACPKRAWLLLNIARLLYFRNYGMDDLDASLKFAEDALRRSEADLQHAYYLLTVGEIQYARYCREPDEIKLDEAITRMLQVQTCMKEDDPMQKKLHLYLMRLFIERYNQGKDMDDLDTAKMYCDQYNDIPVPRAYVYEPQERPSAIYSRRYLRFRNPKDLDKAIEYTRSELKNLETSPELAGRLIELAEMHGLRFFQSGNMEDSENGIAVAKRAVDAAPADHANHIAALHCLTWALCNHNNELTAIEDVEKLIAILQEDLSTSGTDNDGRAKILTMLGMVMMQRFRETASLTDLETGIRRAKDALALPTSPTQRSETLDCLSGMLHEHFNFTGNDSSMNDAVTSAREAVKLLPKDDLNRQHVLVQYGRQLANRSLRTGSSSELDDAISVYQEVNQTLPKDHFQRIRNADALAILFTTRFKKSNAESDMETAIALLRENVEQTKQGSQERALKLFNLGGCIAKRFHSTNRKSDLEAAIRAYRDALRTPFNKANDESKAKCLYSVAALHYQQYRLTSNPNELNLAIQANTKSIQILPENHPDLVTAHLSLGRTLECRPAASHDHSTDEHALQHFLAACQVSSGPPNVRIIAAHRAMSILSEKEDWIQAARIADLAVDLLPRVCSRRLGREDQAHAVRDMSMVAADACSISLRLGGTAAVSRALQYVEFGRGLIIGNIIDEQSDISELEKRDYSLAKEYERLRFRASEATAGLDEIYLELQTYESKIRRIPGLENFLQPPSVEELIGCASDGPIIIVNLSDLGADAIIISKNGLEAVELSEMKSTLITELSRENSLAGKTRDVAPERPPQFDDQILGWLWSSCVHPILQYIIPDLDTVADSGKVPRVWWIGTGAASQLPFHAATSYGKHESISALDLVISSYTPTIKALQNARCRAIQGQEQSEAGESSLLIITMPTTPGGTSLRGVTKERRAIQKAVKGKYCVTDLEHPDVHQALDHMKRSQVVHFACHGASDPLDPLRSHLLLQKPAGAGVQVDRLAVKSLLATKTEKRAWTAYLSACSTAQVKSISLMDESLHVTSAFQMAGFAHVIGSMWPVDDFISIKVAQLFYEFLSNHTSRATLSNRVVPEALRYAVLALRKEYPGQPDLWAPYLHYGA